MAVVTRPRAVLDLDLATAGLPGVLARTACGVVAQAGYQEVLSSLGDQSVNLIIAAPPSADEIERTIQLSIQAWSRVLASHGTLVVIVPSPAVLAVGGMLSRVFQVHPPVVWLKTSASGVSAKSRGLSRSLIRETACFSEHLLFCHHPTQLFPGVIKEWVEASSISMLQLNTAMGLRDSGTLVDHWIQGKKEPTRQQYNDLAKVLSVFPEYVPMPDYADVTYTFNGSAAVDLWATDVWPVPPVYDRGADHPEEKPHEILRMLMKLTTYPGDIILDTWSRSGRLTKEALLMNNRVIASDASPDWAQRTARVVSEWG